MGSVNEGLTAMLSDLNGITIFGCAQEPAKVLALVETVHPNVVILDLHIPWTVGLKTLKQLKHLQPAPVVIMLSQCELPPLREACLSVGADCFLEKAGAFERLREVLAGLVSESEARGHPLARNLQPQRLMPMITDKTSNSLRPGFA
jgi:DNA-binding NarL/FixJ family response regulator